MSTTYTGSLHAKRRGELVEIAEALSLDAEGKMTELKESIQQFLNDNEAKLAATPMFKGLYNQRRKHNDSDEGDTPSGEVKSAVRAGRKSVGRAVEKVQSVIDAADVPLPDSPIAQKVSDVANSAVVAASNASQALIAKDTQRDVSNLLQKVQQQALSIVKQQEDRLDQGLKYAREYLSTPQHLILAFLSAELVHLLLHVTQSYNHTIFFPPPAGSAGTIGSLLHSTFFWVPKAQFTVRVPEWANFTPTNQIWGALAWWLISTVLPAAAGSTLLSFSDEPSSTRKSRQTKSRIPKLDPVAFSFIRFALLLWPLTSAAPTAMVDALEMSGNLQGRALAAGLLATLIFVRHFS